MSSLDTQAIERKIEEAKKEVGNNKIELDKIKTSLIKNDSDFKKSEVVVKNLEIELPKLRNDLQKKESELNDAKGKVVALKREYSDLDASKNNLIRENIRIEGELRNQQQVLERALREIEKNKK